MTCRDIIIAELKRLGACGLKHEVVDCQCTFTNIKGDFICKDILNCSPAKLINGKWEAVEEKVEDKEYCEWCYVYDDDNKHAQAYTDCGVIWHAITELLKNFTYCPECSKEIREVKP